jgi:hypothetical protein
MLIEIGLPPPLGSKNLVPIFRSNNNIVIAPASTGKLVSNNTLVTSILHKNKGSLNNSISILDRPYKIVVKKLILPKILLAPAK